MSRQVTTLRISSQELNDWSQGILASHEQELQELASREKLPKNLVLSWWIILSLLIPAFHEIIIDIFPAIVEVSFLVLGAIYIAIGVTPLLWVKRKFVNSYLLEEERLKLNFQETYSALIILVNKAKGHNKIINHIAILQEALATRASVEVGQKELLDGLNISKLNFRRAFEQEKQWRDPSQPAVNSIQLDLTTLEKLQQQAPSGHCRDLLEQIRNLAVNTQQEVNQVLQRAT